MKDETDNCSSTVRAKVGSSMNPPVTARPLPRPARV
jgi:hypothetical protein